MRQADTDKSILTIAVGRCAVAGQGIVMLLDDQDQAAGIASVDEEAETTGRWVVTFADRDEADPESSYKSKITSKPSRALRRIFLRATNPDTLTFTTKPTSD